MCMSVSPAFMSVSHVCAWCLQRSEGVEPSESRLWRVGSHHPESSARAVLLPAQQSHLSSVLKNNSNGFDHFSVRQTHLSSEKLAFSFCHFPSPVLKFDIQLPSLCPCYLSG